MSVATTETLPQLIGDGRSHAKTILFGEHAVVYGAPAIALPVPRLATTVHIRAIPLGDDRVTGIHIDSALFTGDAKDAPEHLLPVVTAIRAALSHVGLPHAGVSVRIGSTIPHERGLGSSAAVAAAIARAVADFAHHDLELEDAHAIVQEAERVAHGSPSGLDAHAVIADGPIRFQNGVLSAVRIPEPLTFVIADTGIPGSTAEAVGDVRTRRRARPAEVDEILRELAEGAERGAAHLVRADRPAIGAEMRRAHELLTALGVSTPGLNSLVAAADRAHAHGAKLTGGGLGGCVIALADSESHAERLAVALRQAGAPRTWTLTAGGA